jgi:prepilin-type N-terminal cleavage/methylation domain-containing protein
MTLHQLLGDKPVKKFIFMLAIKEFKKRTLQSFKNYMGFTLIELLVVLSMIALLAASVFPMYGNLQGSSQLNESSSQIIQIIRTARERSAARLNNSNHGVYFESAESDRYVLYQGSSFDTREQNRDRETILEGVMNFSLPGGADEYEINFSKGLGMPSATGTIILNHEVQGTRTIIINSFGMVEEE